ncbi:hypothetical protein [Streptomyces sp. Qhu_M48]|uniref:hypothetical protein n=1 Tax=Streptomyces sp. Qhu_M48 TaxID=3435889 RepID=UPI003F4F5816
MAHLRALRPSRAAARREAPPGNGRPSERQETHMPEVVETQAAQGALVLATLRTALR